MPIYLVRTAVLLLMAFLLQEMNDEEIVDSVDFSEFEALFQVKRFKKQRKKRNTG